MATRYIAVELSKGHIGIFDADDTEHGRIEYTPAGWHPPHMYSILFDPKTHVAPAVKKPPLVHIPGHIKNANTARVVDPEICAEIDAIDAQLRELRIKRAKLYSDNFLTFRLVGADDLRRSLWEVYESKQAADAAYKEKKGE